MFPGDLDDGYPISFYDACASCRHWMTGANTLSARVHAFKSKEPLKHNAPCHLKQQDDLTTAPTFGCSQHEPAVVRCE